jgi:hypothetical protein
MEHTTRIVPHSKGDHSGYYRVDVKRKCGWWGTRWEAIRCFLPAAREWNPMLLQYKEAREFAIRMKNPAALEAFERNQIEKWAACKQRAIDHNAKLYPVDEEVF